MRIHCLENVDKALQFLREQRVHLENMGSHDIVDGNPRLSLGLIWTIILRFQVRFLFFFFQRLNLFRNLFSLLTLLYYRFKILQLKKQIIKKQNPLKTLYYCGVK